MASDIVIHLDSSEIDAATAKLRKMAVLLDNLHEDLTRLSAHARATAGEIRAGWEQIHAQRQALADLQAAANAPAQPKPTPYKPAGLGLTDFQQVVIEKPDVHVAFPCPCHFCSGGWVSFGATNVASCPKCGCVYCFHFTMGKVAPQGAH